MTAPAPTSSLIRAALFVADLERAVAFYGALGLTETYYSGTLDAPSVAAALQVPSTNVTQCRIVKRPGTPNYGMVGLFEVKNAGLAALPREESVTPRAGEAAVVFYVSDMDDAMAAARAHGAAALGPVSTFTMPHRSQREACVRDPDGVLVNFIERPVDEQFSGQPVA